jgi:hypothetical protein
VSPIYAFFKRTPSILTVDGRHAHEFQCTATNCKGHGKDPRTVRRYLDKTDRNSTGNLRKHARLCWGDDILRAADACGNLESTREGINKSKKLTDGSIIAAFERTGEGKVTYSHRQHDKAETRAEIVRWVSESMRPFSIVGDRGFLCLMKTGRPEYYLPSEATVSRDVKKVFMKARSRIATMLKVRI